MIGHAEVLGLLVAFVGVIAIVIISVHAHIRDVWALMEQEMADLRKEVLIAPETIHDLEDAIKQNHLSHCYAIDILDGKLASLSIRKKKKGG
jgi:hypothetical protein